MAFHRPNLPYKRKYSLPNNTRFDILATTRRPPTAAMFDAEFNALTDDVNDLAKAIEDVVAKGIPGASDEQNANKFVKTDGYGNLSWTFVNNENIEDGAIITEKLSPQSVTTDKIGDGAVTNDKIDANAIKADEIAPNAVTAEKINANAVTTDKIAAAAITTTKIADEAITTDKIAANAVTADELANNSVGTANLIDNNVTTAKIADANVTTAKIADLAVNPAKISSNNAPKGTVLTAGDNNSSSFLPIPTIGKVLQAQYFADRGPNFSVGRDPDTYYSYTKPFRLDFKPKSSTSKIFLMINGYYGWAGDHRWASAVALKLYLNDLPFSDGAEVYRWFSNQAEVGVFSDFIPLGSKEANVNIVFEIKGANLIQNYKTVLGSSGADKPVPLPYCMNIFEIDL